jgi:hypothetical protein
VRVDPYPVRGELCEADCEEDARFVFVGFDRSGGHMVHVIVCKEHLRELIAAWVEGNTLAT